MGVAVVPRDAATVVLLRAADSSGPGGFEVYMMRRRPELRFMGGFYVFPGGSVDPDDRAPESLLRCRGVTADEASAVLPHEGGPSMSLAFWVTAIRELFEEAGVLLGDREDGRPVQVSGQSQRLAAHRSSLQERRARFAEIAEAEGLLFRADALRYLARYITSTTSDIRFDARFFLARLPGGQEASPCLHETTGGLWISAAEAIGRWRRGAMEMLRNPTVAVLQYLAQFGGLEDLWGHHADGRHRFECIPR